MRPQAVLVCPMTPALADGDDVVAEAAGGGVLATADGEVATVDPHPAITNAIVSPRPIARVPFMWIHATRPDVTGPRRPQSDGVPWPDESLTDSSAGRHIDHRSRAPPIVPSPQAPRRHVVRYELAAWTARTAGRRPRINSIARATMAPIRMAEKAIWRIGACMPVRRRHSGSCFIDSRRFLMGIWSGA